MRCFLVLTALFGGSPQPAAPMKVYVNRDLITVVAPVTGRRGSEYSGAKAHLSFNSQTYRYVAETPEEIMKMPCVTARGDPD